MKCLLCKILTTLVFTISLTLSILAQTDADEAGKNELSVWGGASPDSNSLIGKTQDARFGIVAVRYARRFNNNDTVNVRYTADFIPAARISFPFFQAVQISPNAFRIDIVRRKVYAYGATPLGVQFNFRPRKKVQPFVGASGGFLYFKEAIPDFTGTRFNFTAEVGGGIDFRMRKNRAVTVGYKYYHVSNANRGVYNPGFDNNLFYVGYRFLSK
jgi:opacity protein-like surface antigen